MLSIKDFNKVDLRVGTITDVKPNKRARIPAYKVTIDLGPELGVKNSSAQITDRHTPEDLVGKQVIVVANFNPIRVADVKSEVRILGAEAEGGCILLSLEHPAENGSRIF